MNVKNDLLSFNKQNLKPMNIKPAVMGPPLTTKQYFTPAIQQTISIVPSTSRSKSTASSESQTIISICEGRGSARGIVGIAAINIHCPILILSQIPDGQTYTSTLTKLNILRPTEILIPTSFIENATPSRLYTILTEKYPNITVQSIARNEFNRNRGLQCISCICADAFSSVKLIIQDKFYAASAACALIRYIENKRHVTYTPRSIKVEYQELEDTTMIDIDTADLLNLVTAYKTMHKIRSSLLGVIDKCVTNVGRRLLRQSILQPPCRPNEIEARHDCVTELIQNPQLLARLRDVLTPLNCIENSLVYGTLVPASATSVSEKQLTYTLQLKKHLIAIEPLSMELRNTKHPKFRGIYERLIASDKYTIILKLIGDVLNEDAQLAKGQAGEIQRCFAIKSGLNGFLDIARKMYTEIVDNMRAYVDNLSNEYNLPIRAQHTQKLGFHIILPLTNATKNMKASDLPNIFYKIERYTKHFAMTTIEMISFEKQIKNTSAEIQSISNVVIYKLLTDIRPYIGDLYELCDNVAFLDMLASFALSSSNPGYVRPSLSKTYMLIEEFKHPILEYTASQDPVTNSVCAIQESNIQIITGPNMSGKTIHVRSLCLIQILSQLGCRVPATKAVIRPCDHLYAQLANDMTLECGGMSSFTVEMNKFSYLLQTMSDNSFIVLDELCKTTNCDEGFSIAFAICEELAQRRAFAFIVTHYLSLGVLAQMYPNVTNWQFEVLENLRANNTRNSLKFTFKKIPGVTAIDAYGIKLAGICVDSISIVDRATELWQWMSPFNKTFNAVDESGTLIFLKKKLEAELNILKIRDNLTPEIKQSKIEEFKKITGVDFTDVESIECVTPLENVQTNNVIETSINQKTRNSFSISQTTNESNTIRLNSNEFSENYEQSIESSFHDPLNHILKTTNSTNIINNKRKFEDITQTTSVAFNESASFLNHPTPIIQKPLVSELYFSSSSDEEDQSVISLSTEDENIDADNESFLSIDHQTFVKNIQQGVLTSTPIRNPKSTKCLDESKNDFQISNYEKFSDRQQQNNNNNDGIVLSFIANKQSDDIIENSKNDETASTSTSIQSAKSLFSENKSLFSGNKSNLSETKSIFSGNKSILSDTKSIFSGTKSTLSENKSIFSDTKSYLSETKKKSFMFHPNLSKSSKKKNFQPPFKKEEATKSSLDIFSQETVIQHFP